ncbi:MAG: DUF3899 domain-containing protein [Bacilli bacterium]|nr:DUF3899 domain-containing protein [Bacilli bacterium]
MKSIDKKRLITLYCIGILLVGGCLFIFKILNANTLQLVFTSLCNSFFAVGGIILCLGLLIWCGNKGAFIGLTFTFRRMFFEKRRSEKAFQQRLSYSEYREKKLAKQKKYLHFIIVGVSFIIISIIFLLFI